MFNVERIKEIVTGPIEPNVPNTLWIDTTNPESPVLKVVVNGAYRAMTGSSSGGDGSDKCHCNIVTVELGDGDYIPAKGTSLPVFSEELNSEIWEYLEDGKCVLIKGIEGLDIFTYFLLDKVEKMPPSTYYYNLNFDIYAISSTVDGFTANCCAPENYQALKDYRVVNAA